MTRTSRRDFVRLGMAAELETRAGKDVVATARKEIFIDRVRAAGIEGAYSVPRQFLVLNRMAWKKG